MNSTETNYIRESRHAAKACDHHVAGRPGCHRGHASHGRRAVRAAHAARRAHNCRRGAGVGSRSEPAENLLNDVPQTEYASNGKGTETFVEFDFGAPVTIGAFRHVNRNDRALVAASQLTFMRRGRQAGGDDCRAARGPALRRDDVRVAQAGQGPAGPLAGTKIVTPGISCVGGSGIRFFKVGRAERRRTASVSTSMPRWWSSAKRAGSCSRWWSRSIIRT